MTQWNRSTLGSMQWESLGKSNRSPKTRQSWTRSSTAYCGWPCFGRRVGLDDPQRSLPTPNILWFCDYVNLAVSPNCEWLTIDWYWLCVTQNPSCKEHTEGSKTSCQPPCSSAALWFLQVSSPSLKGSVLKHKQGQVYFHLIVQT